MSVGLRGECGSGVSMGLRDESMTERWEWGEYGTDECGTER